LNTKVNITFGIRKDYFSLGESFFPFVYLS
jgi:hypothetical protein